MYLTETHKLNIWWAKC